MEQRHVHKSWLEKRGSQPCQAVRRARAEGAWMRRYLAEYYSFVTFSLLNPSSHGCRTPVSKNPTDTPSAVYSRYVVPYGPLTAPRFGSLMRNLRFLLLLPHLQFPCSLVKSSATSPTPYHWIKFSISVYPNGPRIYTLISCIPNPKSDGDSNTVGHQ